MTIFHCRNRCLLISFTCRNRRHFSNNSKEKNNEKKISIAVVCHFIDFINYLIHGVHKILFDFIQKKTENLEDLHNNETMQGKCLTTGSMVICVWRWKTCCHTNTEATVFCKFLENRKCPSRTNLQTLECSSLQNERSSFIQAYVKQYARNRGSTKLEQA